MRKWRTRPAGPVATFAALARDGTPPPANRVPPSFPRAAQARTARVGTPLARLFERRTRREGDPMLAAKQIWPLLKQTVTDWLEDKAPKLAASLALYTMLSIGPLMVIVLKVIGVVFR